MKKIEIGNTGVIVTEVCHGTLIMGKLQADMTPEQAAPALRRSFELGVNFYDTAEGYGSYPHLALAFEGVPRNRFVIASKSHAASYGDMKKAVDDCLRALSLDRVGLFHLHLVPSAEDLEARSGALECLIEYKRKGLSAPSAPPPIPLPGEGHQCGTRLRLRLPPPEQGRAGDYRRHARRHARRA